MSHYEFDVVIIGAGPAGVAAAGSLGGSGISVALLEAGVYAGAENWSGCVYFAESLAEQDCFGAEAVAAAPYERAIKKRGTLMHNGLDAVGLELVDPGAFRNCYTVLRPIYDPYFADLASKKGAVLITGTTVTSLIRKNGRVAGVETNRGPLYADVTFLAEGDASHLVRAEQLERISRPHFLQGVKAVLSLDAAEIEKRFDLGPGEGAAYELLIRNASIAGRTAKLNMGGFLYTNRDSLSVGYVAPLDNIRNNFRGSHDTLYEWMLGLPYIKELTEGASLSSYGTKIIRSGGWKERPVLVENGLVVGGAATGLGIDLPFPNFTGPASASGLCFGRAVRNILKRGSSCDANQLTREYITPLLESVHGRNARYLSRWPGYFGRSAVLFGRTVDIACGTAHFLSEKNLIETGRFLRSHILSLRGLRELISDTFRAVGSLRLWRPIAGSVINPFTLWQWTANLFRSSPDLNPMLGVILRINGRDLDARLLPWPVNSLIRRLSPALILALQALYANDGRPLQKKIPQAVRRLFRGFRLTDFVVLPAYALTLFFIALGTALGDAFRFYILKTPVTRFLEEPAMAYAESQKKKRDLDAVKPVVGLDAKLATNTYRIGSAPHIRTLWPEAIVSHPEMSQAGLWWVCPARVYGYDAPPFAGRGRVAVNFENCIKCESCWRAEPDRTLWGRHTDHQLIYRPESSAITILLDALRKNGSRPSSPSFREDILKQGKEKLVDETMWYLPSSLVKLSRAAENASSAFRESISKLPASADKSRTAWPVSLAKRLLEGLAKLETGLANDARTSQAEAIQAERKRFERQVTEGRLLHAWYSSKRIEERLRSWTGQPGEEQENKTTAAAAPDSATSPHLPSSPSSEEVSALFPDRIVKQWEEAPMPEEWCARLRTFILDYSENALPAVRSLSSVSPALGLIAAHHFSAKQIMEEPGVCAVRGDLLAIEESGQEVRVKGSLHLVPSVGAFKLLVLSNGKGYCIPLDSQGVVVAPTPSIGFRAAGVADITLDCTIKKESVITTGVEKTNGAFFYLAIALGAGDYLCKRVKEHAAGRIQFPGQMLDTEGRDGIAKLGAVKGMIARTEAWRLLLEFLYDSYSAFRTEPAAEWPHRGHSAIEFGLLCSTMAAKSFGPEPGAMGYDAGQVFGGFAYSEDDLLSRYYRDSSLFRFLPPGYGAAPLLNKTLDADKLDRAVPAFGRLNLIQGEPLSRLASRLAVITKRCSGLPAHADPCLAGEAKAIIIALRGFLVRMEQSLIDGSGSEAAAAAAEVLLGLAEEAAVRAELSAGRGKAVASAVFPVEPDIRRVVLESDYDSFCAAPGASHKSGGFLSTVFDRSPRFVPEMQLHDEKLRSRWADLVDWFRKNCSERRFDGLYIERYIEKVHRLPDEIVKAAKDNRWLATYIPESLDGLGWHKAEYYILNSAAGSFGDAAIDLLIMASTSIGTTPILLGLDEELPRVREELAPLAEDPQKLGEIGSRLAKIVQTLSSPNPAWIKKEYEAVMTLVDSRIRRTRVVKYLAANFLRAFYGAGIAGRRGDFGGFIANLKLAGELFSKLMPDVRAALDELPRRERCHKLFLRYLGHGGVSAFALTEPTAGSDSGGVRTTAGLLSADLRQLDDGRYSFSVNGDAEQGVRYLIDADKIAFTDSGIAYETPDGRLQPIRYDRYDYKTDQGVRYYNFSGGECAFHDIAQVRRSEAGLRYEYYSVTGAKMWITNGSIATQFCLYAQTPEGVTGFMVDRHAEGLKVGADEKKTGQRGSPTNEISIDNVRVPREAVIGYEGHGQVNALETLNVGRCGLAVVSGALMRKLMREAAETIPSSPETGKLLGEAAAVLFGSESLAYYLVGLFDRPHESVRMESAIAKYACSEDIHELITLVEYAFGPEGQTEKYLLEKARRDSRILTIYEGTNEVQRFLILKDLIAQAADWRELPGLNGTGTDRVLADWKNRLRKLVREAASLLGDSCWSDAMLQPGLFPLSEMAGEILRLECIYYRMEWLHSRASILAQSSGDYVTKMLAAADRSVERTISRLEHLEAAYRSGWENIKNNLGMPEVRAADAALDEYARKPMPRPTPLTKLRAPIRVLSIIRPVAELSSRPRITDGDLQEIVWRPDPTDLAALSGMLEIRSAADAAVVVDVLMPGDQELEWLLMMTAGGVDGLCRLAGDPDSMPAAYVSAIKELETSRQYDLIVSGSDCLNGDSSLGAYLAGSLRRNHYRRKEFEVNPAGTGLKHVALPAVCSITASVTEQAMNVSSALQSLFSGITVKQSAVLSDASSSRFELPEEVKTSTRAVTNPHLAAVFLKNFAAAASAGSAPGYTGTPKPGPFAGDHAAWSIVDPNERKSNPAVLRASRLAADMTGSKLHCLIPAPPAMWPQLLGLAASNGCDRAYCIDTANGRLSHDGKRELIRMLIHRTSLLFAGLEWTNSFAYAAGEWGQEHLVCSNVTRIGKEGGSITFSLPAYEGRLLRRYVLHRGTGFITVGPEADFPAPAPRTGFEALIADLVVKPDWIMPLPPLAPPTLAQADVIIDLGYGIRDRSGFDLALELKKKLEDLGLSPLFGATRKVTQDLKLLPLDAQIGQTGVRVNPKIIIALGVSGAPQHIDYLGTRAEILCFNKDSEAPLMKLNQTRKAPQVHPILGDLFVTVRQMIDRLS